MPIQQDWISQTHLGKKLALALTDLKTVNFSNYIQTLAALGLDISQELQVSSIKELALWHASKDKTVPQLSTSILPSFAQASSHDRRLGLDLGLIAGSSLNRNDLHQMILNAELFAKIWASSVNSDPDQSIKKNLTTTSRHHIHLGLVAIKQLLQQLQAQEKDDQAEQTSTLDLKLIHEHEAKIVDAIKNYQTTRQKIIRALANILVIGTSLSFGMIQTSVAVFFVGLLIFSPASIAALTGLLAASLFSGAVYSYTNYCTQKNDIPYILNEIGGRDRFLQGFLTFKNKFNKDEPLSGKQQAALGLYTCCFAIPAAAATGAFGFTSTMSIPTVLAFFSIALSSTIITPIAAIVAGIIAVNMTFFMLRSFHTFIAYDQGNLLTFLRRPFDEVIQLVNQRVDAHTQPKMNKFAKIAAIGFCGLFCIMSIAGLAVSSLAGVNAMSALMTKLFGTPAIVSASVGIVVGGLISFLSRSFFTIKKCTNAAVNIFKAFCHQSHTAINKLGLISGLLINIPLSAFFWIDSFLRPPTTVPLIPMPETIKTAALATSCTTVKDVGIVVNSMFDEKKPSPPLPEVDQVDADAILNQFQTKSLVKIPETLNNYSFFKFSTKPLDTAEQQNNQIVATPTLMSRE